VDLSYRDWLTEVEMQCLCVLFGPRSGCQMSNSAAAEPQTPVSCQVRRTMCQVEQHAMAALSGKGGSAV